MNMLDEGAALLNELAPVAAGIVGVYTRKNSGGSVTLTSFIAGNSDYQTTPLPGQAAIRLDYNTRTIIGPVADLVIDGIPFEPQKGDTWTETIQGTVYTFFVQEETGKRAGSFCDTGKTRIRIRLKRDL